MNDCKVFVGLEYHEDVIQVCVLDGAGEVLGERRVSNDHQLRVPEIIATFRGHANPMHIGIRSAFGGSFLRHERTVTGWEWGDPGVNSSPPDSGIPWRVALPQSAPSFLRATARRQRPRAGSTAHLISLLVSQGQRIINLRSALRLNVEG